MAKAVTAIAEPHVLGRVDTSTAFGRLVAAALRDHAYDSAGLTLDLERLTIAGDSAEVFVDWRARCPVGGGRVYGYGTEYAFVRSRGAWHLVRARLESVWDGFCGAAVRRPSGLR
jgi:hypothetical protein